MPKQEEYVAPIKHSSGSTVAHTAAGAATGAVGTGVKWWLAAIGVGAAFGLLMSVGGIAGALGLLKVGGTALLSGAAVGNTAIVVGSTILGGVIAAFTIAPLAGGIGGVFGGFKGGEKALDKVNQQKGAAASVQAQIDMLRAQNPMAPATNIYVPTANNYTMAPGSFPEQGTKMNPAMPVIQGSSVQYDGLAMNQQQHAVMV